MSLHSIIARARARWETMLIDSCVIQRVTGDSIVGTVRTPTYSTIYTGVCSARSKAATDAEAGERQLEMRTYFVRLPPDVTGPKVDDRVTVTSAYDAELTGKRLIVRNVRANSYNIVRVLECEDVQDG